MNFDFQIFFQSANNQLALISVESVQAKTPGFLAHKSCCIQPFIVIQIEFISDSPAID